MEIGSRVYITDSSWCVKLEQDRLLFAYNNEHEPSKEEVMVVIAKGSNFPTADADGKVGHDVVNKEGSYNKYNHICSNQTNDTAVESSDGSIYYTQDRFLERAPSISPEERRKKEKAKLKWGTIIEDLREIHDRISKKCGYCEIFIEDETKNLLECPLYSHAICSACSEGGNESYFEKSKRYISKAITEASNMRRAIAKDIEKD